MRMLLTLADCGSMTVTAKKLHVTQPALTYRINNIENELGFKVFNRSRSGTMPTEAGAYFCETLKTIISEYDEGVRLSRAMFRENSMRKIRIGTDIGSRDTTTLFLKLGSDMLQDVEFSIIPCGITDAFTLLEEGVIDFWSCSDIVLEGERGSELEFTPFFETRTNVHFHVNHRFAALDEVSVSDFKGETIWLWPKGRVSRVSDYLRGEFKRSGIEIQEYVDDVPVMISVLLENTVAIYDSGFLSPSPHYVVQRPIRTDLRDRVGFAYLADRADKLRPIAERVSMFYQRNDIDPSADALAHAGQVVTVIENISATVRRGGMKDVVPLVQSAIDLGVSPQQVLDKGLLAGMYSASEGFKEGDVFTPELLAAVNTMNIGSELLQPYLDAEKESPILGTAVIGTVIGDKHSAGKNLVKVMLESRGIKVTDLGTEVEPSAFVDHVIENDSCNLILLSVHRTEVLDNVVRTIEALEDAGLKDRVFVMIGGPAVDAEIADRIGADAYTDDAVQAAYRAARFLSY